MSVLHILIIAGILILILILCRIIAGRTGARTESPEKQAGRLGEKLASIVIKETFDENDVLLNNIAIRADGKEAEIDSLIVNDYWVYIIEVKNYHGQPCR